MSDHNKKGVTNDPLSKQTSIFGLRLWVILGICVGVVFVLFLVLISLWLASKRSKNRLSQKPQIPIDTKEIQEIIIDHPKPSRTQIQADPFPESGPSSGIECQALLVPGEERAIGYDRIKVEIEKEHMISYPERFGRLGSPHGSGEGKGGVDQVGMVGPEVSHLGWGHWYTLRELEDSTKGFADENVIGEGGYGIVYHGVLWGNTEVAVKNLLNNRGQAEKDFKVEVEAIGRVRHKNLVRFLGYCAEGAHRMLVYEYVNNGNLEQWLHGEVGPFSPLTWDIRMNIILGTAKGLSYLHEGLEPKVVHRDIKSSNILLDKQWNPKVSDFGLAKLLGSENSYITTRVMGTFGYVAPEYASMGMLNERSDIYSFGILIMEIISGRKPVDYSRPPDEAHLVDWLKKMVTDKNPEGVLDPKLLEKPPPRALKRALLVSLRCVDPNAQKRPKMGHVIHMLEAEGKAFKGDCGITGSANSHPDNAKNDLKEKPATELHGDSERENVVQGNETRSEDQEGKQ